MSKKISEIRERWGEYAFDIEYQSGYTFTMFFNSLRNAQTVRRCLEVDDSTPNEATAVDFVEVVRCRDCKWYREANWDDDILCGCDCFSGINDVTPDSFCSYGERRDEE